MNDPQSRLVEVRHLPASGGASMQLILRKSAQPSSPPPAAGKLLDELRGHFAPVAQDCAELARFLGLRGKENSMRQPLAQLEVEAEENAVAVKRAKLELSGEPLARRLAELEE